MNSDQVIAKIMMVEAGIIPAFNGDQLSTMLSSLTSDEKRKCQRKFRKIWRALDRKKSHLKMKSQNPDEDLKRLRSVYVVIDFLNRASNS